MAACNPSGAFNIFPNRGIPWYTSRFYLTRFITALVTMCINQKLHSEGITRKQPNNLWLKDEKWRLDQMVVGAILFFKKDLSLRWFFPEVCTACSCGILPCQPFKNAAWVKRSKPGLGQGHLSDLSGEVEKEGDVCNFEPHEVVEIWQSPAPRFWWIWTLSIYM